MNDPAASLKSGSSIPSAKHLMVVPETPAKAIAPYTSNKAAKAIEGTIEREMPEGISS